MGLKWNWLGDLKIPVWISQAQALGLCRDLGMVWEFATNIERSCLVFLFLSFIVLSFI